MNEKAALAIISDVEKMLGRLKALMQDSGGQTKRSKGPANVVQTRKKFSGVTKAIDELIEDGFFDNPRKLGEIQTKLRDEGIKKPTTSLMTPILALIRGKRLIRTKPPKGQYVYSKRKES